MKILVVSLLRLGDLVMQTPALSALRKKYPRAEIHLLTNDSNKGIVPLLPHIKTVHYFPRKFLQLSQGEAQIPTLWGHNYLQIFMAAVNAQGYSIAVNLTHNKLSGHLMDLIEAEEKQGLVIDEKQRPTFGSRWFRYMNNVSTTYSKHKFHLSDLYQWACEGDEYEDLYLQPTADGELEAAEILKTLSAENPIVVLQTQTSDIKKNWRATHWLYLIQSIQRHHPNCQVLLMGSPSEKTELEKITNMLADKAGVQIVLPSLAGAFSLLRRSQILVSVDTSIKHIGSAAGVKLIELCLGSSDLQSTGAYSDAAYIVRSKEACAPCNHSSACHRDQHMCSVTIAPQLVYGLFSTLLNRDSQGAKHLAEEFSDQAEIFVTAKNTGEKIKSEFWTIKKIGEENACIERAVELTAWKHLLSTVNRHAIDQYGSLGYQLAKRLKKENISTVEVSEIERRLRHEESQILSLKLFVEQQFRSSGSSSVKNFKANVAPRIVELESALKSGPIFSYLISEKNEDTFSLARALISQANDALDLYQVQNRIIRNFDSSMEA